MISRWQLLLQATLLTGIAVPLPAQTADIRRATDLVLKRDFAEAEGLVEKILRAQPTSAEALNLKGLIAAEKGDLQTAETSFDTAIKAKPKLVGAHINLGYLYQRKGQPELALRSFQRAIELLPGDPEASLNAAVILADAKRYPEAVQILSKVPERDRTARHWEVLGRVQLTLGEFGPAENDFAKVLEREPESVEALRALSGLALRRDDVQTAWDYIARARRLAPNSSRILYEFGQVSLAANYIREGVLAFRRALIMDETNAEYCAGLIIALMMTTDFPMAAEYIERYIRLKPEDGWGYYMKGKLFYSSGRADEAVPLLERAVKMNPDRVDPHHYLGRIASDRGENDLAVQHFRRALELSPDHAPTHLRLGMVWVKTQEYEAAEKELRRALELDPRESTVHLQLSLVLSRTGRPEEAAKEVELHKKLKAHEEQKKTDGVTNSPFSNPVKK